jgi:hypothetical protein
VCLVPAQGSSLDTQVTAGGTLWELGLGELAHKLDTLATAIVHTKPSFILTDRSCFFSQHPCTVAKLAC